MIGTSKHLQQTRGLGPLASRLIGWTEIARIREARFRRFHGVCLWWFQETVPLRLDIVHHVVGRRLSPCNNLSAGTRHHLMSVTKWISEPITFSPFFFSPGCRHALCPRRLSLGGIHWLLDCSVCSAPECKRQGLLEAEASGCQLCRQPPRPCLLASRRQDVGIWKKVRGPLVCIAWWTGDLRDLESKMLPLPRMAISVAPRSSPQSTSGQIEFI